MRGYLLTFLELERNVMYGVYCDILSKDGARHMNARATSLPIALAARSKARTVFARFNTGIVGSNPT
jgi:hypothetical protein